MANKNIKKYYTLIQKRNAIKTTLVSSHPSHNKNQETNDKFWQTCKAKWTLPHSSGGREIDPATTEICAKVPPKLKNKAFHMILLCTILGYTHKGIKASSSWKYLHTHICCRQAVKSAYVLTNKWINEYLLCLADKKKKGFIVMSSHISIIIPCSYSPTHVPFHAAHPQSCCSLTPPMVPILLLSRCTSSLSFTAPHCLPGLFLPHILHTHVFKPRFHVWQALTVFI